MPYGVDIRNEFGEAVVDFNACLEIVETGFTSRSGEIGMGTNNSGTRNYRGPQTLELTCFSGSSNAHMNAFPHHIGTGFTRFTNSNVNRRCPTPLVSRSATYFYQVGSIGLLHHSEHVIDPAFWTTQNGEYGMFAMCLPTGNAPLPYIRAEPFTPKPFSGAYGLQLRDGNADVVFDSRADFLSISEVRFVTKGQINDILFNDAVVDLTLRTPAPNCYVATPGHTSHRKRAGNNSYQFVKIEQVNDTTVRLSRVTHGPSIDIARTQSVVNDTVIILARNPFI